MVIPFDHKYIVGEERSVEEIEKSLASLDPDTVLEMLVANLYTAATHGVQAWVGHEQSPNAKMLLALARHLAKTEMIAVSLQEKLFEEKLSQVKAEPPIIFPHQC